MGSTTPTTSSSSLVYHAAAHGAALVWPELLVLGLAVLALMFVGEWRRAERRERDRQLRPPVSAREGRSGGGVGAGGGAGGGTGSGRRQEPDGNGGGRRT